MNRMIVTIGCFLLLLNHASWGGENKTSRENTLADLWCQYRIEDSYGNLACNGNGTCCVPGWSYLASYNEFDAGPFEFAGNLGYACTNSHDECLFVSPKGSCNAAGEAAGAAKAMNDLLRTVQFECVIPLLECLAGLG